MRSSFSGYAACAMASSRLIMPLKYSSAMALSIVFMPNARLVYERSTEPDWILHT